MRILIVHNKYQHAGGEDVAVALQQKLLQQKGHEVKVLFFDNKQLSSNKISAAFKSIYNRAAEQELAGVVKEFNPDIVHVHNFFFAASPSIFIACKKMSIPVVITIHNYRLACANALFLRNNSPCELCRNQLFGLSGIRYKCYRNSATESALVTSITAIHKIAGTWKNKINRFIFLTEFAKEKLLNSSLSIANPQATVIPNFTTDVGPGNTPREQYYLFVGRLVPEKGLSSMLEAFKKTGLHLRIAGDGPDKETMQQQHEVYPNIMFMGNLSKDQVSESMKNAKALIFPSLWYEGLPYTIIESLSAGTPVIASKLGAMQELITDGYNGFHFEAGNAVALAECIMRFEHGNTGPLYVNARRSYVEHFHPDIHYQQLQNLYSQVITESKNE
ncbi:MAG: glycosyltransferase [Chitinophagaceae bacterium]|nr:glycosyltransferase [Chitinophagaceae bacterium]